MRLALEEHVIAEGAGALALAAGKRIAAKRKCAVVSGGNLDAGVLASLLQDVRPRPPRKPRQRERLMPLAALPSALPAGLLSSLSHTPSQRRASRAFSAQKSFPHEQSQQPYPHFRYQPARRRTTAPASP